MISWRSWALFALSLVVLVGASVGFALTLTNRWGGTRAESSRGESLYREVMHRVENDYVTPVDYERAVYGAMRGLVNQLDAHSKVYAPGEWESFQRETQGEVTGTGMEVVALDGQMVVACVAADSPAARAGIAAADRLVEVAGKAVDVGARWDEAVRDLAGEAGTRVAVVAVDEHGGHRRSVVVARAVLDVESVHAHLIDRDPEVAHLHIVAFRSKTAAQFRRALSDVAARGARRLIIDLRFNRGGSFDQAVELADDWIAAGIIVRTHGRNRDRVVQATPAAPARAWPTVILTNGSSASASEVFAGALQDHHAAVLVGERTFGKGVVQEVFAFKTWKGGMKLTTAHDFTPAGRCIESRVPLADGIAWGNGILPDVLVATAENERAAVQADLDRLHFAPSVRTALAAAAAAAPADRQLDAALAVLRGRSVDSVAMAR